MQSLIFFFLVVTSNFHLIAFDRTTYRTNYTVDAQSKEDCSKKCNNTASCYESKWEIFGSSKTCELYSNKSTKNERWKSNPITISTSCLNPKGEFEECFMCKLNF